MGYKSKKPRTGAKPAAGPLTRRDLDARIANSRKAILDCKETFMAGVFDENTLAKTIQALQNEGIRSLLDLLKFLEPAVALKTPDEQKDLLKRTKETWLQKIQDLVGIEIGNKLKQPTPWWPIDDNSIPKCNSVEDVQSQVLKAKQSGKKVRVCGAQHSLPEGVFDSQGSDANNVVRLKLDGSLRKVQHLGNGLFLVGAGTNLGIDPHDPTSNAENSFTRIADKTGPGYALPILGGMSHQTIGGFLSTSTAGGSLFFGISDCLEWFQLVDGNGIVREFQKGTDEFNAAAVSMGLFGILTAVKFQLQQKYNVGGTEQTVSFANSILGAQPAPGVGAKFVDVCRQNQYVHTVWFPNKLAQNVLEFVGNQSDPNLPIVEYVHPLQDPKMDYLAAAGLWLANELLYSGDSLKILGVGLILSLLNPVDPAPRRFNDHWYRVLPNDDLALIDTVIRVQFTEIWISVDDADAVITQLQSMFSADPVACGSFGVEVYVVKKSPYWLSMSYGRDCIRIDPYWFEYNPSGSLDGFFSKFWTLLLTEFPSARLHWGKHFPAVGTTFANRTIGADYCRKSYDKFDAWLQQRQHFDPNQVFVTDYWRDLLGISQPEIPL